MAQPWLAVEQMLHQIEAGRGGLAAGAVIGVVVTHKLDLSVLAKDAPLFKGHQLAKGYLRGLPQGALSIGDRDAAWVLAREAKAFQDETARLRRSGEPLPDDWLDRPVNLQHHEARGGHTMLKHVGASTDLLLWRLRLEKGLERSTFHSITEATDCVERTLANNREGIRRFQADENAREEFSMALQGPAGIVLVADGSVRPAHTVVVVLRKVQDHLVVFSAYLESEVR